MALTDIWNYFFADPMMELYKFQCGSSFFAYAATSGQSFRFENLVYEPEYIVRTGLHYSSDYAKDTLTVTIPVNNSVAQIYMNGTPEHLLHLTVYRGSKHAASFTPIWLGLVNGASFDFSSDTFVCELACETAASRIPLSNEALIVLQSVPRNGSPWVFPSSRTESHLTMDYTIWDAVRQQAGLKELRLHDLRHSFASFLVNSGRSLYEVQRILGHYDPKVTMRYAHLAQESLVSAANIVGEKVMGA